MTGAESKEREVSRGEMLAILEQIKAAQASHQATTSAQLAEIKADVGSLDDAIRGRDGLVAAHLQISALREAQIELARKVEGHGRSLEAVEREARGSIEAAREEARRAIAQTQADVRTRDAAALNRWWKLLLALATAGGISGGVVKLLGG